MEQYQGGTDNYVVKDDNSLGEGREEKTVYPCGSEDTETESTIEQKVGDHHEYE